MTLEKAIALRKGKRLVFTNGVFDILHAGHVQYLKHAATLGELLIVGVNSDASVRMLAKGEDRPINESSDRVAVLEALRAVDGAVVFEEANPSRIISELRPEVHVKGGDYKESDLPEASIVRAYGGDVAICPLLEGRSTTAILKRVRGL